MSYIEHATEIVQGSGISAHVLLSKDGECCFFWPIFTGLDTVPPHDIGGMSIRTVGIAGRTGDHNTMAFNEPLDSSVLDAVGNAFTVYCNTVNTLEVAELERIHSLPDDRMD